MITKIDFDKLLPIVGRVRMFQHFVICHLICRKTLGLILKTCGGVVSFLETSSVVGVMSLLALVVEMKDPRGAISICQSVYPRNLSDTGMQSSQSGWYSYR